MHRLTTKFIVLASSSSDLSWLLEDRAVILAVIPVASITSENYDTGAALLELILKYSLVWKIR